MTIAIIEQHPSDTGLYRMLVSPSDCRLFWQWRIQMFCPSPAGRDYDTWHTLRFSTGLYASVDTAITEGRQAVMVWVRDEAGQY